MDAPGRVVHPLLVAALVLVAVCGYLAGHHRVSAAASNQDPPSLSRVVSGSGLLIEYPVEWEQSRSPASIPGLSVASPITIVPRGTAATGLLSGELPAGEAGPLPAAFLARLHSVPRSEVVELVSTQAYRYSDLEIPGYHRYFDLYLIPTAGGAERLMACFAPERLTPASQQCEGIVAGVTLTGPASSTLTPEPAYGKALAGVIAALDRERAKSRAAMSRSDSAAEVGTASASLASRFAAVSSQLATLEPPQVAAPEQAELSQALRHAGDAYSELSVAARAESVSAYDSARTQVATAETAVDAALESFALLGYGTA
jgi:hypothetical protein